MPGLSMLSRVAIVIGAFAILSPCALAQSAARPGQGHSKMKFTPVKASFSGKKASFSGGVRSVAPVRAAAVSRSIGVSVRSFGLANTAFARNVRFKPVSITKQTSTTKSNFAKSRASFVKKPTVRFVRTAPIKVK